MNLLLKQYIKNYLNEATSAIINPASNISGRTQHQQSASYRENMTNLDNEVTLLKVLENVGDNCFISFVDEYDEFIPRLEISPNVSYDTPHGNYAYPLNISSLKEIVEKSRIKGARFALDRPYFHMFKKSNSVRFIEIQKDGSNNYFGNLDKDLRTIVHMSVVHFTSLLIEKENRKPSKNKTTIVNTIKNNFELKKIKKKIKNFLIDSRNAGFDDYIKVFLFLTRNLSKAVEHNSNKIPSDILTEIVEFLTRLTKMKALSKENRFFDTREQKVLSDFHILYYSCWMLSDMIEHTFEDDNQMTYNVDKTNNSLSYFSELLKKNRGELLEKGPVFTMLLNSIDIDLINDKGSSTLHDNEPVQAVYLNSSKKENIVLVGTFNNIFSTKKINSIDDLFSADHESSSSSNKTVTMEKIINILEQNPQLNDLFGTELFDDVKLENSIEDLREKAWKDLTKKESKFFDFILFHSSNKIFNFNIYLERNGSKLIVFDIGIKEKFLNSSIEKQLKIIKREMPKIVKIEDSLSYIQVFLQKNKNKNIYRIEDKNGYDNIMKIIDKLHDYTANLEWNSLANDEERTSFMMIKAFFYICEDISQLAGIARHQ